VQRQGAAGTTAAAARGNLRITARSDASASAHRNVAATHTLHSAVACGQRNASHASGLLCGIT
jgi:hypothetical protein